MKNLFLTTGFLFFTILSIAQNKSTDVAGIWKTSGDDPAKIQIYAVGEKFYGKIIWLNKPILNGKERVDIENPDKAKRTQNIVGLQMLNGFEFNGSDSWNSGTIYDPKTGKTYSCTITFKDSKTIKVRGYIGISLLGRTEIWTKEI
ncbi:MAG: DUF2147 domain-containing protein [Panacibacter sp.]